VIAVVLAACTLPIHPPSTFTGGCPPQAGEEDAEIVAQLRAFLAVPPPARLEEALLNGDDRLLGVCGYTVNAPHAEDRRAHNLKVLGIPGTTDAVVSDEHMALFREAYGYAETYNALLLDRVRGGGR
jgi:hypothetical protein